MSRPFRTRTLVAVVGLVAAGCQDYNFNPVGHCLIQPGGDQFTLSSVSTADVLFVVDDSGSMEGEQLRLADDFGDFVDNLDEHERDPRGRRARADRLPHRGHDDLDLLQPEAAGDDARPVAPTGPVQGASSRAASARRR